MRTLNDNYNNESATSTGTAMVRQRFVVQTYAKTDPQTDGDEKRIARKQWENS